METEKKEEERGKERDRVRQLEGIRKAAEDKKLRHSRSSPERNIKY